MSEISARNGKRNCREYIIPADATITSTGISVVVQQLSKQLDPSLFPTANEFEDTRIIRIVPLGLVPDTWEYIDDIVRSLIDAAC